MTAELVNELHKRIAELEAFHDGMKAGAMLYALTDQLGIRYSVPRCRWQVDHGGEYQEFGEALADALAQRKTGQIPHNPRPGHP